MGKIIKNGIEYGGGGGGSGTGGHTIVDTDGSPVADEPKLQFTGLDVQDNSTDSETEVSAFGLNADSLDDIIDSANIPANPMVTNGLVYSTAEQIVGKWIDGKPLYQKTFVGQLVGNSDSWSDVSGVIINNADYITVKKADFIATGTSYDGVYPMPYGANVFHRIVNGQYKIYISGSNWMSNHSTYHVTLEYTKTS